MKTLQVIDICTSIHKIAEFYHENFPISWRWVELIPSGALVLEYSNGMCFNLFVGYFIFKEFGGGRWAITDTKILYEILFDLYPVCSLWQTVTQ